MSPDRKIGPEYYKGVELRKYMPRYQTREDLVAAIDKILTAHPEYLTDLDNMFRELTRGTGKGKPHMSGISEDTLTFRSGQIPRRVREKKHLVKGI